MCNKPTDETAEEEEEGQEGVQSVSEQNRVCFFFVRSFVRSLVSRRNNNVVSSRYCVDVILFLVYNSTRSANKELQESKSTPSHETTVKKQRFFWLT